MKKFLALLLVAGLFAFAGCKKKDTTSKPKDPPKVTEPSKETKSESTEVKTTKTTSTKSTP